LKETLVEPTAEQGSAKFRFKACAGGGNDALIVENLKKSFDGKKLFENVNIHINKGERIFLIGANGCGKTTLLKIILGLINTDMGNFKIGANTFLGYHTNLLYVLKDGNDNEKIEVLKKLLPDETFIILGLTVDNHWVLNTVISEILSSEK
jgi:ATP-binding cassette subfamily F protein 3